MASYPVRYEIYFADLNPTVGGEIRKVRPVVVISQNEMNQFHKSSIWILFLDEWLKQVLRKN